jgi:hypothetical protein
VLAVVQQQQQFAVAEVFAQHGLRPAAGLVVHPERLGDSVRHQGRILHVFEFDDPDPVRERPGHDRCDPVGEPRLAHAAHSGERDEPYVGEEPADVRNVALAPDEAGGVGGKTPGANHGSHTAHIGTLGSCACRGQRRINPFTFGNEPRRGISGAEAPGAGIHERKILDRALIDA